MKIPVEFSKYSSEIQSYIESPMFFIFDNELVNMYQYLGRLSDSELTEICKTSKFKKMCNIVMQERNRDFGKLSSFVNERGLLNISGLLPILSSFPTFNDAMNFIMRIKPGFRYTPEFKEFVESNMVKTETVNTNGDSIDRYTLDRYKYEIHDSEDYLDISYYRDDVLHRVNGPAIIALVRNTFGAGQTVVSFTAEWYINGKKSRKDGPAYIKYECREGRDDLTEIYKWYTDDKLDREDGPAVVRIFKPLSSNTMIRDVNWRSVNRDSESGREELERRKNPSNHIIIRGEGESIFEEYWRKGEKISV